MDAGAETEEAARLAVADALRAHGVDMTIASRNYGFTILHAAVKNAASVAYVLEHVPQLLNVADKSGRTPLWHSASNGQSETTRMLLDAGGDFSSLDKNGVSPLSIATTNRHLPIVQLVLERGAVSTPDKEGVTPISIATTNGHLPIVQLLVEHGADYVTRDRNGKRLLDLARQRGHEAIVIYLAVSPMLWEHK